MPSCDRGLPKTVYIDRLSNNSAEFPGVGFVSMFCARLRARLYFVARTSSMRRAALSNSPVIIRIVTGYMYLLQLFAAPTAVDICFTEDYLHLQYFAKADTYLKNTYTQCNSETYNQEVMEVFIAPFSNDSVRYHEVWFVFLIGMHAPQRLSHC